MADEIEIKELSLEYYPEIVEIHRAIMKGKVSPSWMKSIKCHLREKDVGGYVALKDGKVAGIIIGQIQGPSFGLEKSGWVTVVEAHPQFMGSGVGRALVESIFQYFREKGVKDIHTAVKWDAVDMLSFFIAAGFGRSAFINLRIKLDDVIPD